MEKTKRQPTDENTDFNIDDYDYIDADGDGVVIKEVTVWGYESNEDRPGNLF